MDETQVNDQKASASDNAAKFAWKQDDVFDRIAERYDTLCDVFSVGIHRVWKRRVAARIASEPWNTLLDSATGTGDVILRVLEHESTLGRIIRASDISSGMLSIAERRLAGHAISLSRLDAEAMPDVADGSVDAYSMSLGLKICNRHLVLSEAYKYLLHGIREFPSAEQLAVEIREHGFVDVTFERLSLGIVAIHTARKP